ncbi:MAG: hypothetical protein E7461_00640 [Ruminococcaceae bacterium]|nr:hypothetical protein [Oscillospiraceae bacterium]
MHKSEQTSPALIGLIFVYTAGSALGIWVASGNVSTLAGALQAAGISNRFPLALSAVIPLFAVYLVTLLHLPGLIFPILFLKAATDSFLMLGICAAYGNAAWLAGALLLFSDKIATVFLIYFAGKCLVKPQQSHSACFLSVLIAIALMIAVDHFHIAPYFSYLIL